MTAHPSWCDITVEHHHVNDPLRDAHRVLAHSLSDEAYKRPTYEWYRPSWKHVIQFVIGVALVYLLIVAFIVIGGPK